MIALRGLVPPLLWGSAFYFVGLKSRVPMSIINPSLAISPNNKDVFEVGSEAYHREIRKLQPSELKTKLLPYMEAIDVRRNIIFLETESKQFCATDSTNYFTGTVATILGSPGLKKTDEDAFMFAMKHEIAHIKHNDTIWKVLIVTIASIASAIFITSSLPFIAAVIYDLVIGILVMTFVGQIFEIRADNLAIQHATNDELLGGRRFFKAVQLKKVDERTSLWKKLIYNSKGDLRISFSHPSFASRIMKIETALQSRNIVIDENHEHKKIEVLKDHLVIHELQFQENCDRNNYLLIN